MMSVRHSLLALLERRPMYGYGLKGEFEAATGHMWPLNDGQVYTTLARLERDGLVEADAGADGQKVYRLAERGRPPGDPAPAGRDHAVVAGAHPPQGRRAAGRRPLLAAGARQHAVPGRGRGALAGPLRGEPGQVLAAARTGGAGSARAGHGGEPVMSILELREVHRVHGSGETAVHALRGVSLTVGEGELVAVMGPSGSGKSTLLNLAGGLDRPTRGEVVVEGTVLGSCSRRALAALRRRRVGYVFQDLNLLASLMAAENVALPLELDGVGARQARRLALAALSEVDLDGYGPLFQPDELLASPGGGQ